MLVLHGSFVQLRRNRLVKGGKGEMNDYTTFLYARPSFVEGMARVIDLGGTLNEYNVSPSGADADYFALSADVEAIGQDMRAVLESEVAGFVTQSEEPEAIAALMNGQEK